MIGTTAKKILISVLVVGFAIQTLLVYSDDHAEPLTGAALRGRELWHQNACQVCHQLYGQGGFLGPDLTNAASRVEPIRLRILLTRGSGQMPAFHLSDGQIHDVAAYLKALDQPSRGRGQLRLGESSEGAGPWGRFDDILYDLLSAGPEEAASGHEIFRARACAACHLPLRRSSIGGTDLTLAAASLSPDELRDVLSRGRPGTAMPAPQPALTPEETQQLISFLQWMNQHRPTLEERMAEGNPREAVSWSAIPWWEYR